MRKIGGHFRSALTAAIKVENDMIPTAHRLNHKVRIQAINGMKRSLNHPTSIAYRDQIRILDTVPWKAGARRETRRREM